MPYLAVEGPTVFETPIPHFDEMWMSIVAPTPKCLIANRL